MQFLGVVSHDVVPTLLAAADVAVAPSVHDDAGNVDGLPNTVMEIMASGTPLVATPAGGIGAVATDGTTARLVPERDVRALASAIDGLLRDRPAGTRHGPAARAISSAGTTAGRAWRRISRPYTAAPRNMLSTIASLIAIAYLPGAVVFRLPIADREKRAALPAEERAVLGGHHQRHRHDDPRVCAGRDWKVFARSARVVQRRRLRQRSRWHRSATCALARCFPAAIGPQRFPAVLIAAGCMDVFRRAGGRICAWAAAIPVCTSTRASRSRSGNRSSRPTRSSRRFRRRRAICFFRSPYDPNYYSVRFMGFHLRDPEAGTVTGQFPQGYPIWIAIAYGLDGITGTRRVIAWWAILGVLTVYFAGRRLIGPLPAAAAAGLLCVHVIQTWYARYPNSEIVTQALLFAALLAHAYAHEDEDRFFGPVSASLLGLALVHAISRRAGSRRRRRRVAARARGRASRTRRIPGHDDGMACRRRRRTTDTTAAVLRPAYRVRAVARSRFTWRRSRWPASPSAR